MRIFASIALVVLALVLGLTLATGPLYSVYDAEECSRAYSRARTRADSGRVDFHPYKGTDRRMKHRCREVRVASMDTNLAIAGLQLRKQLR